MLSNLSEPVNETLIDYPAIDSKLPFCEYIAQCRSFIKQRRLDIQQGKANVNLILEMNSPFELYPARQATSKSHLKYGALLVHGLLDSPFSLKDIGEKLCSQGILSRAMLLPGHGTCPNDLLQVSYHDWVETVRYGVDSLRKEVDRIVIVGYSTGATLAIHHAIHNKDISGIVLISPAIQIKAPVTVVVAWHYLLKSLGKGNKDWVYCENEIDCAKYHSIAFNPITQVTQLTKVLDELNQNNSLNTPALMVLSREDETISSHKAIDFFSSLHNPASRLLLYTSYEHRYPDSRIITRSTNNKYPQIKHLSHASIPFAPSNHHYGKNGDYQFASRCSEDSIYGAYNRIETNYFDWLHKLRIIKYKRRELTYNPDFDFMSDMITSFILENKI